jgi:hypothetical protein
VRKKWVKIIAIVLIAIIIIAICLILFLPKKVSNSQSLIAKVNSVNKHFNCSQVGINQFNGYITSVEIDNKYSATAREDVLNYVVDCNFADHHVTLAVNQAKYLVKIYEQNKAYSQAEKVLQLIGYMQRLENIQ